MNKIRIRCLCDGIRLPDLSLKLKQGESVVVLEDDAKASSDLKHAVSVGGVATYLIKGPSVLRENAKSKKPRFERRPPPAKALATPEVKEPSESEKMRTVLEDVLGQHRKSVEKMVSDMTETLLKSNQGNEQQTVNIDISAIEAVVKTALQGVAIPSTPLGAVGAAASLSPVDSGPMFIPEGIVVDTKTDLGAAEESSGFSVDEATEALRAMKKTRKSKKKGG